MNRQHSAAGPSATFLVCILSLSHPALTNAQTVYKSADAQGRVTYSQSPPPAATDVEAVTVRESTGGADPEQAQNLRQEVERQAAEAQRQREAQKERKAAAVSDAERRLRSARESLEAAKRRGDGDWQTFAWGGRVESDAYRERVSRAERDVRDAERALRDAKVGKLPPETP